MPLPGAVARAPDTVIEMFAASQRRLEAEYAQILTDPLAAHRRRRISALTKMIDTEMSAMTAAGGRFLANELPAVYQAGATGSGLGFSWTQVNRAHIEGIQQGAYDNLLQATEHMRGDAKRWIGEATRQLGAEGAIEGQTAQQLAKRFARLGPAAVSASGAPSPITAITYADGSKRTLDTYGEMLFRTTTAVTHNNGAVIHAAQFGVTHYQLIDGSDCGLTSHDDPNKANGKVVSAETALAWPIAHPNCGRSMSARLDLAPTDSYDVIIPTANERALAEQLDAAREQLAAINASKASGAARTARSARSARTPRTPRASAPAPLP